MATKPTAAAVISAAFDGDRTMLQARLRFRLSIET
jgi:hypothetical protein